MTLHVGDALDVLRTLPDGSANCCVTSPPYWGLRDYLDDDRQIGLEQTPDEYVARLVAVFAEVRRVLREDGTLWLNIGDSYAGSWGNQGRKPNGGTQRPRVAGSIQRVTHAVDCDLDEDCTCGGVDRYQTKQTNTGAIPDGALYKAKDLVGVPWLLAFALRADGWYLRSDVIWHKPNPMPSPVRDRPTSAHEHLFLMSRSARYHYDADAIAEPSTCVRDGNAFGGDKRAGDRQYSRRTYKRSATRNRRDVWTIATAGYGGGHIAPMPERLVEPCVLAGCPVGGTVLDPFIGSGTVARVAERLGREWIGIDIDERNRALVDERTAQRPLL